MTVSSSFMLLIVINYVFLILPYVPMSTVCGTADRSDDVSAFKGESSQQIKSNII